MNGLWDYNDKLSVDAATGQPEQAPLTAAQRSHSGPDRSTSTPPPAVTGGGPAAGAASGSTSTWGMGSSGAGSTTSTGTSGTMGTAGTAVGPVGGAAGGSVDDFERSVRDMFLAERRDLVRDLLEVPEVLRVRITADAVTFVDDLQRLRTYPTNGKLQKYQIGAAQFQARAYWSGAELHKEIEATGNFHMTEVYRLSESGTQLLVAIRIGDPKKNATLAGLNRVYDRVAR